MWKKLFKEKKSLVPTQKESNVSEREKKQIQETQEWMEIGQLIERFRKKSDSEDVYVYEFKHNAIPYRLGWRRRSALLELGGEISGEFVKIAYAADNYYAHALGVVFHLPVSEEGKNKLKQMVRGIREELLLNIAEQEKKHRAKQEEHVEKKQKDIQQKTQTLEKYL